MESIKRSKREVSISSTIIGDSQKVAKNAGIISFTQIPSEILSFINGIIITRILGAYNYGLYSSVIGLIGIARPFLTLGMQQGCVRYINSNINSSAIVSGIIRFSFSVVLLISIVCALCFFLFSEWIAANILRAPIGWLIRLSFLLFVYAGLLEITFAYFRAIQKIALISVVQKIILPGTVLFVNLLLVYTKSDLQGVVWRDLFIQTIILLISIYLLNKFIPFLTYNEKADYSKVKELIFFSWPLFLAEGVYVLMQRADILIISSILTPVDVGIYSVVLKIIAFVQVPIRAIDAVVIPMIAEAQLDRQRVQNLLNLSSHWQYLAVLPLTLICLLVPDVLLGVFGNEFRDGQIILSIMALGTLGASFTGSANGILTMYGHSRLVLLNVVIGSVFVIGADILLIPHLGLIGAAIVAALFRFAWALLIFLECNKLEKFSLSGKELIKKSLMGFSIYGLLLFLSISISSYNGVTRLIITSAAILVFGAVFYKLANIQKPEDQLIYQFILKKLSGGSNTK